MAKLDSTERQAARNTVRLLGVTATDRLVTVMFYDDKMNDALEREVYFTEDNYLAPIDKLEIYDSRHKQAVLMAGLYLRDHFQEMYDQMLRETESLQLATA